jgi:hypothetical protein
MAHSANKPSGIQRNLRRPRKMRKGTSLYVAKKTARG